MQVGAQTTSEWGMANAADAATPPMLCHLSFRLLVVVIDPVVESAIRVTWRKLFRFTTTGTA